MRKINPDMPPDGKSRIDRLGIPAEEFAAVKRYLRGRYDVARMVNEYRDLFEEVLG